ncbi:hypothetical protein A8U91_00585 [Halomonas elongata]|uniref:Uncharacterized protein n=1 Tax=Halomonas elongata TaxID=2746 RepID=A0A1B8P1W2_HALEL|nr:hypothetical protein A8U91_00585 [Halomonas elongata]
MSVSGIAAQTFEYLEASDAGQADVEQYQVGSAFVDEAQCGLAVLGGGNLEAGLFHQKFQRQHYVGLIVDHQHTGHARSLLRSL